jgi:hypothetical protein
VETQETQTEVETEAVAEVAETQDYGDYVETQKEVETETVAEVADAALDAGAAVEAAAAAAVAVDSETATLDTVPRVSSTATTVDGGGSGDDADMAAE